MEQPAGASRRSVVVAVAVAALLLPSCGSATPLHSPEPASSSPSPSPTATRRPAAGPSAKHVIQVRMVGGQARFWDVRTETIFVPRGMNYIPPPPRCRKKPPAGALRLNCRPRRTLGFMTASAKLEQAVAVNGRTHRAFDDVDGLAALLDLDPQQLRSDSLSFEEDGDLIASRVTGDLCAGRRGARTAGKGDPARLARTGASRSQEGGRRAQAGPLEAPGARPVGPRRLAPRRLLHGC